MAGVDLPGVGPSGPVSLASDPRLLAFAGSLRSGSFNRLALRYAVAGAREAGALVQEVRPDALRLPLYDGDLERAGSFPDMVEVWREQVRACDAMLIASPEYNHGLSAVLKNAIDWASRPPNAFDGKVAASFGVSPGRQGTARSQQSLRLTLSAVNVWVLPRTVLIPFAREAFDESGNLKDERQARDLAALGRALAVAARAGVGRL
jgi:chromate reductase, NAD(P)H dehydrogenase (quinone)